MKQYNSQSRVSNYANVIHSQLQLIELHLYKLLMQEVNELKELIEKDCENLSKLFNTSM